MTAELVFVLLGVAVAAYALTAGADFGSGVWDLLARGPRREQQRELIAEAIAPIWEVNHIWMIFVVVILFTVFPDGFAVIMTALHIPLVVALFGIVLRGSAFVFRAYGMQPNEVRARWGQVFAWASAITPVFLGMSLAALSSGAIRVVFNARGEPHSSEGFFAGWWSGFALCVGLFSLALFAMLAAVYLAREAEHAGKDELAGDFRRRGLAAELVAFVIALLVLWRAKIECPGLYYDLFHAHWSIPAQVLTALVASGAIWALIVDRLEVARVLVMIQVGLIVLGWGLAMNGFLVRPDLHIGEAGAEPAVLAVLPWVLLGGAVLLVPGLIWLFRLFDKLSWD